LENLLLEKTASVSGVMVVASQLSTQHSGLRAKTG